MNLGCTSLKMNLGCTSLKNTHHICWAAVHKSKNKFGLHNSENKFGLRKSKNKFGLHKSGKKLGCTSPKKYLSYLLYGSVASLPSPSSNIEAWPYGTSLHSCIWGTIFFIFERTSGSTPSANQTYAATN